MIVYLNSLGCVRNMVDSEAMLGALAEAGHTFTQEPADAEAIIVNTCGFIESAAQEAVDTILEMARYKEIGKCRRLVVTGCLPERYREETAGELPEVDVFLGTGAYDCVVEAVEGKLAAGCCRLPAPETLSLHTHRTARLHSTFPVVYLKITEGCNRHCTYCIIPKLRGCLRSRSPEDIEAEATRLGNSGFREIIIIGQDTTSYGIDLDPPSDLAGLIQRVAQAAPHARIRFLYGHPDRIDDDLLRVIQNCNNICPYFDIPIQHASPSVLKRMGRRHDEKQLLALFQRIRAAVPDAVLRTTVMVGFPGETEDEFMQLLHFVETVEFDHLGAFNYSDADDLPSHGLSNHVPGDVADARHDRLMELQARISLEKNRRQIGKTVSVLVEEKDSASLFKGRTIYQAPEVDGITSIRARELKIGQFLNVRITGATEYDLEGVPA